MITKEELSKLYIEQKYSVKDIAKQLGFSTHKISYWMDRYNIKRRSISDAIYSKRHPDGDPFQINKIQSREDAWLQGIGIGLYWGEGTKSNKHSIRLGNTDPELIKMFMRFLTELYGVRRDDLRFGLQLFTDINPQTAIEYWLMRLNVRRSQFCKTTVTISGSIGTYRKKSEYGVLTVYYHNKKLRDILIGTLPR